MIAVNAAEGVKVIGRRDEGSRKIVPPSKEAMRRLIEVADPDFRGETDRGRALPAFAPASCMPCAGATWILPPARSRLKRGSMLPPWKT